MAEPNQLHLTVQTLSGAFEGEFDGGPKAPRRHRQGAADPRH